MHALKAMESDASNKYQAVVCLHPTSPFRTGKHIDEAIQRFEEANIRAHPALASVRQLPIKQHFNVKAGLAWVRGGLMMNGAIYIVTAETLKATGDHAHACCSTYLMDDKSSLDLDNPLDWVIAEAVMRNES